MLLQVTNISAGNISIPFGPTLAPQESCILEGNHSIDAMTWLMIFYNIPIEVVGGLTKETRLQYDTEKTVVDMYFAGLIKVYEIG